MVELRMRNACYSESPKCFAQVRLNHVEFQRDRREEEKLGCHKNILIQRVCHSHDFETIMNRGTIEM